MNTLNKPWLPKVNLIESCPSLFCLGGMSKIENDNLKTELENEKQQTKYYQELAEYYKQLANK